MPSSTRPKQGLGHRPSSGGSIRRLSPTTSQNAAESASYFFGIGSGGGNYSGNVMTSAASESAVIDSISVTAPPAGFDPTAASTNLLCESLLTSYFEAVAAEAGDESKVCIFVL